MLSQKRIGVLLGQLGTPDAPTPQALRRYLNQFLSDRRVIDSLAPCLNDDSRWLDTLADLVRQNAGGWVDQFSFSRQSAMQP